ncbi:GNAT family N-acetyltransferase [uncultured Methanospirillum sp.]|uniref:GNAT family N-acetyltransferase n=1 Tax=uncultured Methanospirillum sp. TaxID=262503 RepID=UPI0029C988E7|nr:GNAT family N-acetyltransferase [uncultured Methanospirillum sp.]
MISVNGATLQEIETMRITHLSSLPEFQDLYLELQIPHADAVILSHCGTIIGYAITKGGVMLEFFVKETFGSDINFHFPEIVKTCNVERILVQSFDQVLMKCCSRMNSYHEVGLIYRDFTQVTIPGDPDLSFRLATLQDLPFLQMQEDEVFEPKDMISTAIEKSEIVLCLNGEMILGCGFITRIHPLWAYYDIGVWVSPEFRLRGYAARILSWLKETCVNNCWIPVCGCGVENIGSQRTIEKNGFISNHRLLSFDVGHHDNLTSRTTRHP